MTLRKAEPLRFPFDRKEGPFVPPTEYDQARSEGRVVEVQMWNDNVAYLATSYVDVVSILTDNRFSADPSAPGYPSPTESRAIMLSSEPPALGQIDPPAHSRFRRMFTPMFTMRRIEEFRPQIEEIINTSLDEMIAKGGPADLCAEFSYTIPTAAVAALMGVPQEDRGFFIECANARFFHTRSPEAAVRAGELLGDYFEKMLAEREENPQEGNDIVNRLVREQILPGELSREDAVVLLRNILVNGQDTTANTISLGILLLLQNPEQLKILQANPSKVGQAINELLRIITPPHFQAPRTALEDVEVAGMVIEHGRGVIASLVAADHDPTEWDDPERLDIDRDASNHVAFGSGIHACLGRQLATLELELAFTALVTRLPNLALAVPFDELRFTENLTQAFGILELPVTW